MMNSIYIILGIGVLGVGIAALFLVLRMGRRLSGGDQQNAAIVTKLDSLQDTVNRVREETRKTLSDELRETRRESSDENSKSRKEVQDSLETFRVTLETLRKSLSEDQKQGREESQAVVDKATRALTEQFEKLSLTNEQRLKEIQGKVDEKLSETITRNEGLFKGVSEKLQELHATNERISRFSQELNELQTILKAPKLRGELGEMEMERMLRECLHPDQYDIQYSIGSGRVDAVIHNPEGKLAIDSKFPLESYNRIRAAETDEAAQAARKEFVRAVKKHIDDIQTKYIKPPLTLQFAVMYIPAEGVYYQLIETPELMEYARVAGVYPASPTSFWALLQVIVIGFHGMRLSEDAHRIEGLLRDLQGDLNKVRTVFDKAATQVRNANSNMEDATRNLDQFGRKLDGIRVESGDQESLLLRSDAIGSALRQGTASDS
ncbi:DNA recombination protein RmuC [bacterium]|jgi:DNA recombination protein RmuC|nr:DNA recombination protein RmuC [bacterium]